MNNNSENNNFIKKNFPFLFPAFPETFLEQLDLSTDQLQTVRDLMHIQGSTDPALFFTLALLFKNINRGSLCLLIDESKLKRKLGELFIGQGFGLEKEILRKLLEGTFDKIVTEKVEEYFPLILKRDIEKNFLYFQKFFCTEKKLALYFRMLLQREDTDLLKGAKDQEALLKLINRNPYKSEYGNFSLNREQKIAVSLALFKNFFIISGGPGTGKTSIIITLLRLFFRLNFSPDRIKIAAPTGRAAQKIKDTIHLFYSKLANQETADEALLSLNCLTLHRLLKFSPSKDGFLHNEYNKIEADLIILDEISMIDADLMLSFLRAVDDKTRLIFIGDKDQLPSVDAGQILSNLVTDEVTTVISPASQRLIETFLRDVKIGETGTSSHADRIVMLKECMRSEREIIDTALKINAMDSSVVDSIPTIEEIEFSSHANTGVGFIKAGSNKKKSMTKLVLNWIEKNYFSKAYSPPYMELVNRAVNLQEIDGITKSTLNSIFNILLESRIITVVRQGASGSEILNDFLTNEIFRLLDKNGTNKCFAGLPIIITKNDYFKNLFNGDAGVLLKGSDNCFYAVFKRGGEYAFYPAELLQNFEPAFAITVHKSQGSEYKNVFFILPDDPAIPIFTKEIVYTAITRAKKSVLIYGNRNHLKTAISRRIERESGFNLWD